jgi:hypothetical protein
MIFYRHPEEPKGTKDLKVKRSAKNSGIDGEKMKINIALLQR